MITDLLAVLVCWSWPEHVRYATNMIAHGVLAGRTLPSSHSSVLRPAADRHSRQAATFSPRILFFFLL